MSIWAEHAELLLDTEGVAVDVTYHPPGAADVGPLAGVFSALPAPLQRDAGGVKNVRRAELQLARQVGGVDLDPPAGKSAVTVRGERWEVIGRIISGATQTLELARTETHSVRRADTRL
jgi:hypothetical protein